MALFLFKTGTGDAKISWEFFVEAIFCFVKICFIYNVVTFESKVEPKSVESSTVSVADTANVALI